VSYSVQMNATDEPPHDRNANRHPSEKGVGGDLDNGHTANVGGRLGYVGNSDGTQYGGGRYGRGPFELSQQFGGSGFSTGQRPFGSPQRQYENRFIAGGHRGRYADPFGFRIFTGDDDRGTRSVPHGERDYRRSGERILEAIYLRLLCTHHVDSSDVAIDVHDRTATLTRTVPERWMKRAIEGLGERTEAVSGVDNCIRVRPLLDAPRLDWHEDDP